MKKMMAVILILCLCISLCACGKSKKSQAVADQIDAIGEVTLESENAILLAEEAYRALSAKEQKSIADSAVILTKARVEYDAMFHQFMKQKVVEDSNLRVEKVIQKIDNIGLVSLDTKDAIRHARAHYDLLSKEEQERITNIAMLTEAETELTKLHNEAKEKAIEKYKSNFTVSTDRVEGITWYHPKQRPKYINTRCYVLPYIGIRDNNAWICLVYNYTGDDWVFWKDVIFLVDGEKYTKSFSNIDRSVGYGDVVEHYQEAFNVGQAMDTDDIKLLQAIADSDETIVRFSGDKIYDFTVSKKDKEMIKNVLDLYSTFAN